ncbi:MAG: response regulator [Bacteroidales bacterium]|nr:response regulator [Bacteroidales bacterium]
MPELNKNIEDYIESTSSIQEMRKRSAIEKETASKIKQLQAELNLKEKEIKRLKNKLDSDQQFSTLKIALKQVQDFLAMSPAIIYFKNNKLEYTYANQSFAAFANLPVEDIMGLSNANLELGNYLTLLEQTEKEVIDRGKAVQGKEILLGQEKEQLLLNTYLYPMKDTEGKVEGVMVCCFDLSERLQFRQELESAKEKALLGVKSKQVFLANLSHEIRTPLHGILGSGALLKPLLKDNQAIDLVENINNSGTALLEMVDSMLLFESIDKGEWLLRNEIFNIRELVQQINTKFLDQAKAKMIDIQIFIAQGLPELFIGDVEKLKLLLSILVGNAIKFTNKGFVHLFVQSEQLKGKNRVLKFTVKDTGSGIKKELQSELFSTFTQGDSSSTKGYQGTGIGLAMAQKTISYLGGAIGFESAEYKGSTFWFSVELEVASKIIEKPEIQLPSQVPVLLVEDNKINQKIAFFALKKLGFPVQIAENGLEAVERFQQEKFKIVLMDLQMPVMNGFDATIKIRAYEKQQEAQSSLIIALSANTIKEDIEKCFVVGMNEYISKPFSPAKLIEVIQKHIEIQL